MLQNCIRRIITISPEKRDSKQWTPLLAAAESPSSSPSLLQQMQTEWQEYTRFEDEIAALHEEIASQKRVLHRYRKLLLLPLDQCDESERQQRMTCAYQRSIQLGWHSISQLRDQIYKLEQKQKLSMLSNPT